MSQYLTKNIMYASAANASNSAIYGALVHKGWSLMLRDRGERAGHEVRISATGRFLLNMPDLSTYREFASFAALMARADAISKGDRSSWRFAG